jgi:hypothetical protein
MWSPQDKPGRKHFKLRVESCVDTILQLDKSLGKGKIRQDVVERFERLRESLENVADETIDERDISRIEEATNQLLSEIRVSLGARVSQSLHEGQKH